MSQAAQRVHFGLTILGCFGGGSLYGWSGLLPSVRAHFSVNNATASMVFSLALVCFTLGVLLAPVVLARVSAQFRLPLLAGLAVLSLGFAGASAGFAGFAIAYGVCFGAVSGALYNHALSRASASDFATSLIPVCVAAFGLGGAVFGPVHVWLAAFGWGVWSVAPALVCFGIVAVLSLVFPSPPNARQGQETAVQSLTKPTRSLVTLAAIFAAGSCSGLIVLGFASQILPSGTAGVGLISLAIFLAALGNTVGRLSSALVAGRFGPARGIAGALVLSMVALVCLMVASRPGVVIAVLFLVAFAYGQLAATMPLLVKSHVDAAAFSGSFGWVFTGWGLAGLVGPWTAGWLLDATGTVKFSLMACLVLAAFSLWLVLKFTKPGKVDDIC